MTKRSWHGRRAVAAGVAAALAAVTAGCREPALFPPDGDRSQYDRHDRLRNDLEPMYIMDHYGRQRPNLRGRLYQAR